MFVSALKAADPPILRFVSGKYDFNACGKSQSAFESKQGGFFSNAFLDTLVKFRMECNTPKSMKDLFDETVSLTKKNLADKDESVRQDPSFVSYGNSHDEDTVLKIFGSIDVAFFVCPEYGGANALPGNCVSLIQFLQKQVMFFRKDVKIMIMTGEETKKAIQAKCWAAEFEFVDCSQARCHKVLGELQKSSKNVFLSLTGHGVYDRVARDEYMLFEKDAEDKETRISGKLMASFIGDFRGSVLINFKDLCKAGGMPDTGDFKARAVEIAQTAVPPAFDSWNILESILPENVQLNLNSTWSLGMTAVAVVCGIFTMLMHGKVYMSRVKGFLPSIIMWAVFSLLLPCLVDGKVVQQVASNKISVVLSVWAIITGLVIVFFDVVNHWKRDRVYNLGKCVMRLSKMLGRTGGVSANLIHFFFFGNLENSAQDMIISGEGHSFLQVSYLPFSTLKNGTKVCAIRSPNVKFAVVLEEINGFTAEVDSLSVTCNYERFKSLVATKAGDVSKLVSWTFNGTETLDLSFLEESDFRTLMSYDKNKSFPVAFNKNIVENPEYLDTIASMVLRNSQAQEPPQKFFLWEIPAIPWTLLFRAAFMPLNWLVGDA